MAKPTDKPNAAAFGKARAALAKRGLTPAHLRDAVGDAPSGRTWREIAEALAGWLKQRPKSS